MKSCIITGCKGVGVKSQTGRRYFTKGYCSKHYYHLYKYGTVPEVTPNDVRKAVRVGDTYHIALGKGGKQGYAIVGLEHRWLEKYKWYKSASGYAVASVPGKNILMHRIITKVVDDEYIDHINHNKLDNRVSNLRVCTKRQNNANKNHLVRNTTGYKGVSYDKRRGLFYARVGSNYKYIFLGYYSDPIEAALAYDGKANEIYGEFALTNEQMGLISTPIVEQMRSEDNER